MANKKAPRTESLPNLDGTTFTVGGGVHWGFNGDAYPGTVVKVSESGRKVWVSSDKYRVTDNQGGYVEGARGCEFTTVVVPDDQLECYTLRKSGHFHRNGNSKGYAWSLQPDRVYSHNPSY